MLNKEIDKEKDGLKKKIKKENGLKKEIKKERKWIEEKEPE